VVKSTGVPIIRRTVFQRPIAIFVLICFTLLNTFNQNLYAATPQGGVLPDHGMKQVDPNALIGALELPEEFGSIRDSFVPEGGEAEKVILYVQNAHTNFDSEHNTRQLIEYFQKEYHLPLVLLEGGEGKLDSLFFRSFPDEKIKKRLLRDLR
jgi:hypothetical protein